MKRIRTGTLLTGCCALLLSIVTIACPPQDGDTEPATATPHLSPSGGTPAEETTIQDRLAKYTSFALTADLSVLSEQERQMIPLLIEAAQAIDDAFWLQAYGDKEALMASIDDPDVKRFVEINYGPWDRLADNEPFIDGVGPKPDGANFYPTDMTREELDTAAEADSELGEQLRSLYTVVRRDAEGNLTTVPYSEAYAEQYQRVAEKLRAAAELAEDPGLRNYLELRAAALLADDYLESDLAWMEMKSNAIDVVIGPIETYEDQLVGAKAANEAYLLIKDKEWSDRLSKYAAMLPALQDGLPVPEEYKQEEPGADSDLNAYDVVYYAGDCNAGSKTIAINLPNDERVQAEKGSRRLQLKNAMRAKFDKILVPIVGVLIAEDQRPQVTFDAFFSNTMFHEVAHGLGVQNTITGTGTVREALQDHSSRIEEGKADVLGLYMVTTLHGQGELGDSDLMDNYVTFFSGIFRSIRFGASSAHGVANLIRFNFFKELGAFSRDQATGTYRADFAKMQEAMNALSERLLRLQGDGDYEAVGAFIEQYGQMDETLRSDLDRLETAGIPVDIVFEQGMAVLEPSS
ncbi:MAG: Zn-dependent hydrolase [bacterium]|nr:Zn-dependent hydrolase [bacterium]